MEYCSRFEIPSILGTRVRQGIASSPKYAGSDRLRQQVGRILLKNSI